MVAVADDRCARLLRELGARRVIDDTPEFLEAECSRAALVVDTTGGALQWRALRALERGAALLSCASAPPAPGVHLAADVTTQRLERIAELIDRGVLSCILRPHADAMPT